MVRIPSHSSAFRFSLKSLSSLVPTAVAAVILTPFVCSVALGDVVISNDDLIVNGSICAGDDCVDGEVFGSDTIRLKEDRPVLKFEDTSSSANFPSNDWSMGVSDTGAFTVRDEDSGQDVIILEAGAGAGVALGAGSTLVTSAVSVGSAEAERRIVHVDDGVDATDAATKGQLDNYISSAEAAVDAEIASLESQLDGLNQRIAILETLLSN